MKLFLIRIHSIIILITFYFLMPFALFAKVFTKKTRLLFCERGYDAQDNAFVLFNYLSKNKDFVCKYVITKKGGKHAAIQKNKQIKFGSLKHLFYLNYCDDIITTHYMLFIPCDISTKSKTRLFKLRSKIVFLQHGIAENYLPSLVYPECKVDIFSCTVHSEYEYVLSNYNHPQGVVRKIGMPRFDKLFENKKDANSFVFKTILVMPTWRMWINKNISFEQTDFYKQWASLLSSSELNSFLKNNNLQVRFVLHSQLRDYLRFFKKFESDEILIIDTTDKPDESIQELLISSDMLITDYSSVAFDFGFMNKPVYYFCFDYSLFFSNHYKPGFFDYRKDGFGPFFEDANNLLLSIKRFSYKDWELKYREKIDLFFRDVEKNCCERYEEVIKKL